MTAPVARPCVRRSRQKLTRACFDFSPLETRRLLAMTVGADGWTTFTPSVDSQIIYVSDSQGSDTNNGLSETAPLKTLLAAKNKLRNGKPDWILLKRGDIWNNQAFGTLNVSGRSMQEPIYFGAYGTGDRPTIRTNGGDGISTIIGNSNPLNFVAIQGLYFLDNAHNGTQQNAGIRFQRKGQGYYIEDVKIQNFKDGILFAGESANDSVTNATVRRSVIIDSWQKSSHGHSNGLYAAGPTNGLLIEENVFDHNGWKDGVAGAEKTVFNHNMYINKGAQNVVIRNNISTRAALRGILTRGGGIVSGNLTARNAIGIETWGDATISNNVILENGDIPNVPQGYGIQVLENNGDVVITDNVIAHDWSDFTFNVFGIRVWYGLNSATITNNITFDWRRPLFIDASNRPALQVSNNQFQIDDNFHAVVAHQGTRQPDQFYSNNTYWSTRSPKPFWLGTDFLGWNNQPAGSGSFQNAVGDTGSVFQRKNYLDPNRDLGSYNASIGGQNSFDAFILAARNLSRTNYNLNYTAAPVIAYIRAGFGLSEITGPQVSVTVTDGVAKEPTGGNPADPGVFTLTRTGSLDQPLTINYMFSGTAEYIVDYTATQAESGTITFPIGVASIDVTITPVADTLAENPETVDFRILSGGTYNLGAPSSATINITDGNGGTIPPNYAVGPGRGGGFQGYPYNPGEVGQGLKGEYFDNPNFTGKVLQRLDAWINYDWADGAPVDVPVNPDTFSVRWTGELLANAEHSGEQNPVTFRVAADDAVKLWIDDILVIDTISATRFPGDANGDKTVNIADFAILAANFNQTDKSWEEADFDGDMTVSISDFSALAANFNKAAPQLPPEAWYGSITLIEGHRHSLRLDYVERTGSATVKLYWSTAFEPEQIIPTDVLFAPEDVLPPSVGRAAVPVFSAVRVQDEDLAPDLNRVAGEILA